MNSKQINSYKELEEQLRQHKSSYLLLYKKGSDASECALSSLESAMADHENIFAMHADVSEVRDIHGNYGITSAPSLLFFEGDKYVNVFKGCHGPDFFTSIFENTIIESQEGKEKARSVTVYSTPSCSWCNTLKTHLRKNRIHFTDIDVSQDMQMAEEMVRKSGQQGVPQTEIDGEIIVGFDKTRINKLLNIN